MVVEEGSLPGLGGKLLIAKKTPKTNSKLLKMTRTKIGSGGGRSADRNYGSTDGTILNC